MITDYGNGERKGQKVKLVSILQFIHDKRKLQISEKFIEFALHNIKRKQDLSRN